MYMETCYIKPMTETRLETNEQFFKELQNAEGILEKKYGNISSFNFFRRMVGYEYDWHSGVMKARGLFLNNQTYEVVGRSYNKFFGINEKPETQLDNLKHVLKFPLMAYLKENGFLGILGYDNQSDSEIFASKASVGGDFAKNFENIFKQSIHNMDDVKSFLKEKNVSMIFEVIDPIKNPHIIEYDKPQVVLLDVVYREVNYRKFTYEELIKVAERFGLKCKEKSYVLNTWEEFLYWYNCISEECYLYKDERIEGFVIEDANGYMLKIKLSYYMFWKNMRKLKDNINKQGKEEKLNKLLEIDRADKFYKWIITKDKSYLKKDIITLRKLFNEEVILNMFGDRASETLSKSVIVFTNSSKKAKKIMNDLKEQYKEQIYSCCQNNDYQRLVLKDGAVYSWMRTNVGICARRCSKAYIDGDLTLREIRAVVLPICLYCSRDNITII